MKRATSGFTRPGRAAQRSRRIWSAIRSPSTMARSSSRSTSPRIWSVISSASLRRRALSKVTPRSRRNQRRQHRQRRRNKERGDGETGRLGDKSFRPIAQSLKSPSRRQGLTMEAHAIAKNVKGSSQKTKLVVDLIRGKLVNEALAILEYTPKRAAHTIQKLLRSAIANAQQKADAENVSVDVDELWVKECFVGKGVTKHRRRMRPAPMGRAYRERRHYSH